MELCSGTLADEIQGICLRDGLFAPEQALEYALHACIATQHLHDTRRVHGDIKPKNLLFGADCDACASRPSLLARMLLRTRLC
jgi:serine/threonine protein kinase